MLYMVGLVVGLFTLASPIVAIVAIVQWINTASRKNRNGGLSDYQVGYRDGLSQATQANDGQAQYVETEHIYPQPPILAAVQTSAPNAATSNQFDFDSTGMNLIGHQRSDTAPQPRPAVSTRPVIAEVLNSADIERAKSSRTLNALLLLGSLLFVAAGIAFLVSGFSDITKLVGLIVIVAVFYGSGMLLYPRQKVLQPAAIAFIGIGLAILPFLGIALVSYSGLSPQLAWLLVSFAGLVAYVAASVLLQSQFVSYLTMAFVLSLAASGVANASVPIFWYFVVLICVSLVASLIGFAKPGWVPAIFRAPIEQVGTIVTPVALASSLLLLRKINLLEYEIVFAVATLQYGVSWLQSKNRVFETVTRGLAQLTLILVAADIADGDMRIFAGLFVLIAVMQQVYSLVRPKTAGNAKHHTESWWLVVQFGLLWLSLGMWAFTSSAAEYMFVSFSVIFVMSVVSAIVTKRVGWAYNALAITLIVPLHIAIAMLDVQLADAPAVGATYLGLSAIAVLTYWLLPHVRKAASLKKLSYVTALLHFVFGVAVLLILQSTIPCVVLWSIAVALVVAASHIYGLRHLLVVAPPLIYASAAVFVYVLTGASRTAEPGSFWLSAAITTAVLYVGVAIYAALQGQRLRRNILFGAGHAMVLLLSLALQLDFDQTESFWTGTEIATALLVLWTGLTVWLIRVLAIDAPKLHLMFQAIYPVYYAVALLSSLGLSSTWQAGVIVIGIGLAWEASYRFGKSWLVLLGNALALWLSFIIADLVNVPSIWKGVIALASVSAIQYIAAHVMLLYDDRRRGDMLRYSAWVTAALLFLGWIAVDEIRPVALLSLALLLVDVTLRFRSQWTLLAANLTMWWLVTDLFTRAEGLLLWEASLLAAALVAATFYVIMWLFDLANLQKYRHAMQIATVIVLLTSFTIWVWSEPSRLFAAFMLLALAAVAVVEGIRYKQNTITEAGAYAAVTAACVATEQLAPSVNIVVYAHLYAGTVAAVGFWLRGKQATMRYIVAMGIVTIIVGYFALTKGGLYSMLFLAEHIVLALVGALRNKRWALVWGIIASVLATLYYLRDIPFLLFTILGVAVIGFVVWRLLRFQDREPLG